MATGLVREVAGCENPELLPDGFHTSSDHRLTIYFHYRAKYRMMPCVVATGWVPQTLVFRRMCISNAIIFYL